MRVLGWLLARPRLVLALPVLLAAWGALAWVSMPRREDPQLPPRWAFLTLPYPGASVAEVERLVVEPVERELWRVAEVVRVESAARAGIAVAEIELGPETSDPRAVWDEVRRALADARRAFPPGVGRARLDDDVVTPDAVVLALRAGEPLAALEAARALESELLVLPEVARVRLFGDPGEQIAIEIDGAAARRLGLDAPALAAQLALRTDVGAAGSLHAAGRTIALQVPPAFRTLEDLREAPVLLPGGAAVPLHSLARVTRGPRHPASERARLDGEPVIAVAVGPRADADLPRFGRRVRAHVQDFRARHPRVVVRESLYQPEHVERRLAQLGRSVWLATALVAGVLLALLGGRAALTVALTIPLVTLSSVALYAVSGGVLHQLSIAALIIAMGLIVDNAIVVTEAIGRRIDAGERPDRAALHAVVGLAGPLAATAGTTIAAFIPIWLASGTAAEFVRAIPVVSVVGIALGWVVAVAVTPVVAARLLRPGEPGARSAATLAGARALAGWLAGSGARRPHAVLAIAGGVLLLSLVGLTRLERSFFPLADRSQLVLTLDFGEGAHLSRCDRGALRLERALLEHPGVDSVSAFVGRAAPLFYYNLNRRPGSPHLAQLVVDAAGGGDLDRLSEEIRELARRRLPGASLGIARLRQGVPVDAPIEVRLYGSGLGELAAAADRVTERLRALPGTRAVRSDLGPGTPLVALQVDDASAGRAGLTRSDLARTVRGRSHGLLVGHFRAAREPVPIVLRSPEGESLAVDRLHGLDVGAPGAMSVPLAQVAELALEWEPAVLRRRNGRRVVSVLADLAPGATAAAVARELDLDAFAPRLGGVRAELGGELEGARIANARLLRHVPLAALLLVLCLLAQFDSVRVVLLVLAPLPLIAPGVVAGLWLGGQALGFMASLGAVALCGIVVNSGILLIDEVERRRAAGEALDSALREAARVRARPIAVTTATTLCGLLPLALSGAQLWPPMAWAMIGGLALATPLSLAVIPALYRLLFPAGSAQPGPVRLT